MGKSVFLENQMSDYKGALSDYTKTIELDSKKGFYYLCRGDVKIKLNDVAGACNDFRKAYELGEIEGFDKIKSHCK
ncbi:MAG: hypothetical protein IPH57_08475 [Saprospiraceae bacterium]|nr:hypothetical protein [Saprospiraceae bacterium]